ncbi:hypothetical protein [Qipengyuania sp. NPDC077563]|uniref:hypothetical protein n=1 Tax=Qipengyuania sp. NPDC077563 TaxID=3364497 RepID=UPI00384CFFA4
MTEPAEVFARIAAELEDMHGVSVEGQSGDQPPEGIAVIALEIGNRLQRVRDLLAEVQCSSGRPA